MSAIVEKSSINATEQHILARDGYPLAAIHYQALEKTPKARLIVAGATGVPQGFYRRFSEYMAAQGYHVLTFDYRGIGKSKPSHLKGFEMSYLDWGQLDLAGAIDSFADQHLPLFVVGHSYGGHALGLLPNHEKITAAYCCGTGSGWHGYMPVLERLKVQLMWNIVFPPMVRISGYLPWSKLNLGEDLPLNAYQQWRKWCKDPQYCFGDPDYQWLKHQYAQVKLPIYAVAALDDAWAMPKSRDVFMGYYRAAKMHLMDIRPQDYGMKEIGHMGYFRPNAVAFWDEIDQTFGSY